VRGSQGPFPLPGVHELLEIAALGVGERHVDDEAAHLGRVVVRDRSLESLAERPRLGELASQPA